MDNTGTRCNDVAMKFFKYHGTGNDFLVVDARDGHPAGLTPEAARLLCDRNFGVGGDGILLVERGTASSWFMRVINSDGTQAEMCGNGIRCVAKFIAEHLWEGDAPNSIPVETPAGIRLCRLTRDRSGVVSTVAVSMGAPKTERADIPMTGRGSPFNVAVTVAGRPFVGNAVNMGNPHFVIFEDINGADAGHWGSILGSDELFPSGANIEFAGRIDDNHFRLTVFERGCGLTMACGTGASATAVAAVSNGLASSGRPIRMDLPGGPLFITVADDMSDVILEGPAMEVFSGSVDIQALCRTRGADHE